MSHPRIAITGAGPAGLTLARILHLAGIPFTIYELDASKEHRYEQGGSLDLHQESGLAAMEASNLTSELSKILRPEGEATRITDHTSTILYNECPGSEPGQGTRPEVDRTQLRTLLLESIPQDAIKWGHRVKGAKQSADETYTLIFENQPEAIGFDILIGCDGAWSKIRPLVSETKPHYSGVSVVEVRHRNVSARNPTLSSFVGAGTLFSLHDRKVICGQRNGDDSIRVYAVQLTDESWEELKDQYYGGWDEKLQDSITKADEDTLTPRTMYMLPIGFSWPQRDGVTVISDAAHLMTPFAGEGVNLAMWDAMLLGQALAGALKDGWDKDKVRKAMRLFEEEMFTRAGKKAQQTWDNLQMFVQPGAAEKVAKMFKTMMT
ncbi:hypothetical protein BJ322DRAFT_1159993 [Thelephora terrestris]|uniref:FAD-binding domain-containing protein n=1 Tax=Thelephora terrestris TaxID=56493 RepID=A0A9P6H9H7_9AGAM|nr:hypothetical protein BJ322DRAFT_1159993 [Thelephora terrestris]